MNNLPKKLKILIGIAVLGLLLLPLGQQQFKWWREFKLDGYQPPGEPPELTWESWANGSYQEVADSMLNEEMGFHPQLVRLHNQVQWSLFNRVRTQKVVLGKENYLYEQNYIDAQLGRDYKGEEALEEVTTNLKVIQDTLAAKGIGFGVIIAPSKASFFPEFMPDSAVAKGQGPTNYDYYAKALPEAGIPLVDFDAQFRSMKDTSTYPLFAKGGIHWSIYGAYLATDSLLNYVESTRDVNLPEAVLDSIIWSDQNFKGDFDIGEALNLMEQPDVYPMGYPIFHYEKDGLCDTVDVLFIGDSFYFTLGELGMVHHGFKEGQFWFYNVNIIDYPPPIIRKVKELDLKKSIEEHDVVLLISTAGNLAGFPWGFDRGARKTYMSLSEQRVQYYINQIRLTEKWYAGIVEKAKAEGIPVAKRLRLDAEYMVSQELIKAEKEMGTLPDDEVLEVMNNIRRSPKWLELVQEKATQQGRPLEHVIRSEASYVVRQRTKQAQ